MVDSKAMRSKVQRLPQDSLVEELVRIGFENMGIDVKPVRSTQVVPIRPSVSTSGKCYTEENQIKK
jgi:hypothetical protein